MKTLKQHIKESILDDNLDTKTDYMFERPIKWFYEESLKCQNFNDFKKLLTAFENILIKQTDFCIQTPKFRSLDPHLKALGYWNPNGHQKMSGNYIYITIWKDGPEKYPLVRIGKGSIRNTFIRCDWDGKKAVWVESGESMTNIICQMNSVIGFCKNHSDLENDCEELIKKIN